MQERLAALDLYRTRNTANRPLDSINHRINTLEFYMFGYEDDNKRFIFSPLGNLFLKYINNQEKLKKILQLCYLLFNSNILQMECHPHFNCIHLDCYCS